MLAGPVAGVIGKINDMADQSTGYSTASATTFIQERTFLAKVFFVGINVPPCRLFLVVNDNVGVQDMDVNMRNGRLLFVNVPAVW